METARQNPVEKTTKKGLGAGLRTKKTLTAGTLLVVVVLALGLRFYGIEWDQGFLYTPHPDERAILAKVGDLGIPSLAGALDATKSSWNPRWFNYGSFPLYLLKIIQLSYNAWPGADLQDLRILGRAISALADIGTVIFIYFLGKRLYGNREGLLASGLVAITVLHIQLSHFFAVDTILTVCIVAAMYFLYGVAKEGRTRDSVLAGACIGLGIATKVSVAPIYFALLMAHLIFILNLMGQISGPRLQPGDRTRKGLIGLATAVAMSITVLVVVQPYTFLDWGMFKSNVVEQSEMVRRIRDYPYTRQYVDTHPYWYHIRQLTTWGLSWPLGVVAWAGLLYASLRGMRFMAWLAYLAMGWVLPGLLLFMYTSYLAILAASAIAFIALMITLPFRSQASRGVVLLLSWVVPYFLITGAFEVKFIRYLIPITPFLVLLGSGLLFALWDAAKQFRLIIRAMLFVGLILLLGSTAFYAVSYMAVYGKPHTAIRTSQWINQNVPVDSVILREHWEEGVPGLFEYQIRELPLYENDTSEKLRDLSIELAEADYVMFFSSRLYGTIPRLPARYPFSSEYYRTLFSGDLGYELVNAETAYPQALGVAFANNTFTRPALPEPRGINDVSSPGLVLNLGFADESFSVYDHPVGLLFENKARLKAGVIREIIENAVMPSAELLSEKGPEQQATGLLLSSEDSNKQRQGGTWKDIVRTDSWAGNYPVLAWLILIEAIGLIVLPISLMVFRPLPDRGYLFGKVLGMLVLGLGVWLLASLKVLSFTQGSIGLVALLLATASLATLIIYRHQIQTFFCARWRVVLGGEMLFLLAFLSFLAIRMANPDLWHPFRGGEKPMDLAYLNAVLKSSYMPPYDPWFGGGYLNYYYWGQFLVAMMVKTTGVDPRVAFNLAVPTFFALTITGAFSIVYNMAEGTQRSLLGYTGSDQLVNRSTRAPVIAGIGGAMFVAVLGNLDGGIQIVQGIWRVLIQKVPFGEFDFWRSTRMMPPDPPGFEITEFPFFTFLFADLHPHLMALPFTLLAIGLSLCLLLGTKHNLGVRANEDRRQRAWGLGEVVRLAFLGLVVGSLRSINAWDFPTYMLVAAASVMLAAYFRNGGLNLLVFVEAAAKAALVFLVGYLAFLPFHLNAEVFFTDLWPTTNQTPLWQFLAINGLFLYIIVSFFVCESGLSIKAWWRNLNKGKLASRQATLWALIGNRNRILWFVVLGLGLGIVGLIALWVLPPLTGSTVFLLLVIGVLVILAGLRFLWLPRADTPYLAFVSLFVGVSLVLAIGVDVYRLEHDIDRQNSVFKFYLQIWVLMALASAYLLWRLYYNRRTLNKIWLAVLALLIVTASIYPVMGTRDRVRDRFNDSKLPMTLDGMAYMKHAVYGDEYGSIRLSSDYHAIMWIQDNIIGSPVVLEGVTPIYRWGGRISVYTGLPSVVGWRWHQEQQRWAYRSEVSRRVDDVRRIYSTTDVSEASALMSDYGVEYVYVGHLEKLYYPKEGLNKFDVAMDEHLENVYENEDVTIYRLIGR